MYYNGAILMADNLYHHERFLMKCNGQTLAIATGPDPQNVSRYTSRARNLSLQGAYFVATGPACL